MPTCKFFQSSVKYLGHIVSKDGISTGTDDEKIVSMVNWKVPQTVKELKSFLTEIKTIPIQISIIYQFFKISQVCFFKWKFSGKSSVFPYIFHTGLICWDPPTPTGFPTITIRYGFFHINKLGIPWTYAKFKKFRPSFKTQPTRASLKLQLYGTAKWFQRGRLGFHYLTFLFSILSFE